MKRFGGHEGGIRAVTFSPDGTRVLTAGKDRLIREWDRETGAALRRLSGHEKPVRALAIHGDTLLTCDEGGQVRSWSYSAGRPRGTSRMTSRWALTATAAAPAAEAVVAGLPNGEVMLHDLRRDVTERLLTTPGWVRAVAVTPDAARVVAGVEGAGAFLLDRATGTSRQVADGTVLAVAVRDTEVLTGGADGTVLLWDALTGTELVRLAGQPVPVSAVAFGDTHLFAAADDGTLLAWERTAPSEPTVLTGHTARVRAVAAEDGGDHAASVAEDGTIRVWDALVGAQVAGTGFTEPAPPPPLPTPTSDEASARDLLGFRRDVRTLAAMIADRTTEPPLCVALLGPWGSGKSSFLRQLHDRVATLATLSRNNPGRSVFASSIRQVRFNAWHYHDDELWVGLVEQLFADLAVRDGGEPAGSADVAGVTAARRQLRAHLADLETERENANRSPLARLAFRLLTRTPDPARRRHRVVAATGAVLAVLAGTAAVLGWLLWQDVLVATAGALVAAISAIASAATAAESVRTSLGPAVAAVRERLAAPHDDLDTEIRAVRERLNQLDAAHRLGTLVDEVRHDRYAHYRGLLGRVHEDLGALDANMRAAQTEWRLAGSQGPPPLQRIVLHIDDLDRCSPRKVVDVLAAVHLLLALPLFVVVVAVDPRWLRTCLREASLPPEYLDKIFQIVFSLRPMGPNTGSLIDALLPEPATGDVTSAATAGAHTPSGPTEAGGDADDRVPDGGSGATVPRTTELRTGRLLLRKEERDYLHRIGPRLPTPRAVKKLLNLYRLVRVEIRDEDFAAFPYRVVLDLLGMLVAEPASARIRFQAILGDDDLVSAIPLEWHAGMADDRQTYRHWIGTIARFGFDTHDLVAPGPG
ncbi:NTPase KAP [Saccharomonospora piscinae]|uniref:WD40 repeat domain-containing protein n=1 Tax=Saccharomonospora piscinae TaxID=687388 RepID=UPI00110714CF|nr:WD40 repeat domain-containing protein [Saccharomonospora piscinae]TLW90426.1 NTPase KAP [Saccharomonospora piscinae]